MSRVSRLFAILAPCILLILLAVSTASAAPATQACGASNCGNVYCYNDNNGCGNSSTANEATLAATPTAISPSQLQACWNCTNCNLTTSTTTTDSNGLTAELAQMLALVNQDIANACLQPLTIGCPTCNTNCNLYWFKWLTAELAHNVCRKINKLLPYTCIKLFIYGITALEKARSLELVFFCVSNTLGFISITWN